MKWKNKAGKAIRAIKEDEFWTYKNPLIPVALVIIVAGLIVKMFG